MIRIRSEQVNDYADIALVHARAFSDHLGVPLIVALQRQRREFDPELSLLAEVDGKVVGHALFSPYPMRLLDQTVPSVNLSPLGVLPEYQNKGIGGQLIAEGHARARAKGYTVSTILGHPTYYPRFGYQTHAFGSAELVWTIDKTASQPLESHVPVVEDIPALWDLWFHEEQHVDLAIDPGHDLVDWLSSNPAIQALVYTQGEQVVGYTRVHKDEPTRPRYFLAANPDVAQAMLCTLASNLPPTDQEITYTLPLHPLSASAQFAGTATATAWGAGMVFELAPSPLPDFMAALQAKTRPSGRPIWPVAFDIA